MKVLLIIRAVANMRQGETIASSWFWSKIDFSEEKFYGIRAFDIQCSKLASSCSEVWLWPWLFISSLTSPNNGLIAPQTKSEKLPSNNANDANKQEIS